jgi:hypothetical protein
MAKQWWHFIPRLGWQRCTEREALGFKAELGEGEKVAFLDDRLPLDTVCRMKHPVAMMHPDVLKAVLAEPDAAEFFASTRIEIRQHGWLPTDQITFIDMGAWYSMLTPKFL